MWNCTQTLLRDKLSRHTAYSVGLVLDSDKRGLQMLYETALALCESGCLFTTQRGGTFFKNLERGRRVYGVIVIATYGGAERIIFALRFFELGQNQFFEFGQVFIGIS